MARLLSVNVGLPREIAWRGKTVYTSVWKEPVQGRRLVRRLNIDGDAQGDLHGHGGEHRAVFVYQMDSYHYWERELKRADFTFGQFGENFTVEGLADSEVCVGDRYRIGGALFEVTQPRVTCYRVGIRMDEPRMAALLVAHHRPGFYFRVLEEGEVGAGDEIVKVAEGPERLTVAAIDALLYLPGPAKEELERALRIPALSPGWKSSFEALLRQMAQPGSRTGNAGLASPEQMVTAAPGFRPLKVARMDRESSSVVSLVLEPADGRPLTVPLPGQFVVLRLRPKADAPPVLRSYSLSDLPDAGRYRITVKAGTARNRQHLPEHAASYRRCPGCQRAPRRLHPAARRSSCGAVERRRGCDSGDGHAPRAGSTRVAAPGLVDLWSPQPPGSSLCPRSTRFAGQAAPCPEPRPVQPARRD